jgi:TonB family protein
MRWSGAAVAGLIPLAALPALALDDGAQSQNGVRGKPHNCDAFYSQKMQSDGLVGSATIAFRVTEYGRTTAIRLAQTSGHDLLDQLAKQCVTRWKYKPATRDGAPVEIEWTARIDFGTPGDPLNGQIEEVVVPAPAWVPR